MPSSLKSASKTFYALEKILFLPQCQSTNDEAWAALDAGRSGHGTLIYAGFQTAGRGQRGTVWQAAPGENLLCSTLLHTAGKVDPTTAFDLSRAVTLSIADAVAEMTSGAVQPALKWPNDLYHEGQKLGGILIENRWGGEGLEWSVIGLGLNINQTTFEPGLRATSLKLILGQTIPLPYCAEVVQKHLEVALDSLDSIHSLRQAYEDRLLGKGIPGKFQKPGQETFAGIILGTTPDGRLRLQPETGPERQYEVKEVQQLFS